MIKKETYKDQVKNFVYRMILNGEISQGEQVIEYRLAEKLSISRAPVREALRELVAEGFLVYTPQKGHDVKKYSPEDVINIYNYRGLLEGYLAKSVDFDMSHENTFYELTNNMYNLALKGEKEALIDAGDTFHNALFKNAKNGIIVKECKKLNYRIHLLFNQYWQHLYTPEDILKRHNKIVYAVFNNKEFLEKIIREHYEETGCLISKIIGRNL